MILTLILLFLLIVSALAAMAARDLLDSVILFGMFSFFSAVFYGLVGALDVSFTEAALGAVIATVFFVAAIHRSGRHARIHHRRPRVRKLSLAVAAVASVVLILGIGPLPPYGAADSPASRHVSPLYIEKALEQTGSKNMVTAVIVDYRGYDTLGETAVIFTAGLACCLILFPALGFPRRKERRES